MSTHWLWYPTTHPGTPPQVTLLMTWRDGYYLANGSDAFVQAVLAEVGVRERVRSWTFQRYRASYFSPDPDETTWSDRWPAAWRLSAVLDAPPATLDLLTEDGRRESDASDDSWSSRAAVAARMPAATIHDGLAFGCFTQLQVDLGEHDDAWYQAGADDARVVGELFEERGATVFAEHSRTRACHILRPPASAPT